MTASFESFALSERREEFEEVESCARRRVWVRYFLQ